QWSNSVTEDLKSGDDCTGAAISGGNCTAGIGLGYCYVLNEGNVRSRFVVSPVVISGYTYTLKATGYVDYYTPSGTKYKTVETVLSRLSSTDQYGIATGNDTSCSIQNSKLYCWGRNDTGQAGVGSTALVTKPALIGGALSGLYVHAVATGMNHACAVAGPTLLPALGNAVYCWGDNSMYQYGKAMASSNVPVQTITSADISGHYFSAVTGRDHTCVVAVSGTAQKKEYCWGNNDSKSAGEASDGSTPNPKTSPGLAFREAGGTTITNVNQINSVSNGISCGIDGIRAYCVGNNDQGGLGIGTTSTDSPKVNYPIGMTNTAKIATNNARECALNAGKVYCWGANWYAGVALDWRIDSGPNFATTEQNGTPKTLLTAASPYFASTVTDFGISDWNTCMIIAGSVYCSGYNDMGQLGQGTTSGPAGGAATSASQVRSANNMVKVGGLLDGQNATKIVGGNNHFCAITDENVVFCWGSNQYGQLGDGTTSNRLTPVRAILPKDIIF
ncbi:MAG: hypothetical protein WBB94_03835, partial [Candidatus Saccharimonadaceae bacterium]